MAIVSGPIKLVTDRPSAVTQVLVGAAALRLHGAGIVVDHPDGIPVVGGVVEFEALPGPAVLTMVSVGGAPMESVEIVVPDVETVTLSECLDQIYVYDPPVVGRAQEFARQAGDAADRAEAGADRVGSAEQVGVWAGEAVSSAKDAHDYAERAEGAAAAADAAAGETSSLIRDEMDAKVEEAGGHAQSAGQSATLAGTHAVATGDDRRQTGLDRQATGEDVDETEALTAASIAAASLVEGVVAEALGYYRGTGFPNGVVAAPVGSIYTDTEATNGAIRWIKTIDTGNTGWEVEYGDTGWRDIFSLVHPDFPLSDSGATQTLRVRRVNDTLHYIIDVASDGADSARALIIFPTGFKPPLRSTYHSAGYAGTPAAYGTGTLMIAINSSKQWPRYQWTFHARDPWPDSLPGVPVN